ncbi:MAG: protein TolQ [Alphaproteobacteria bacterium]|jgi:biopolymer transport protein TolQ
MGGSSFFSLVFGAEFTVQLVILMLLGASVWSWSIIIDKWLKFREIKNKSFYFQKLFSSDHSLSDLYTKLKDIASMPLELIFISAMDEMHRADLSKYVSDQSIANLKERINTAIFLAKNKELDKLENNLGYLATISSASPFIGLFGTVWGIMHSFQSIAEAKNTSLAVVAPGIAEALFATALGLIAAIPALIFYNILSKKLQDLTNNFDDFALHLNSLLSRQLDRE